MVEGDDFLHLVDRAGKRQHRAGIDEHRLVCVLDQIDMALEDVVGQHVPDPPDAIGDLHRSVLTASLHGKSHSERPPEGSTPE